MDRDVRSNARTRPRPFRRGRRPRTGSEGNGAFSLPVACDGDCRRTTRRPRRRFGGGPPLPSLPTVATAGSTCPTGTSSRWNCPAATAPKAEASASWNHDRRLGATGPTPRREGIARDGKKHVASVWYFVGVFLLLMALQNYVFAPRVDTLSYAEFKTLVEKGKVSDVAIGANSSRGA